MYQNFRNSDFPKTIPHLRKTFEDSSGKLSEEFIPIEDILKKLDSKIDHEFSARDIKTALTIAAMRLPDSEEYKRNNKYRRTKILLDENLSSRLIPELNKHLSNLSHIYFEGLQGVTDSFIYWRPWSALKTRTLRENRAHDKTKYIIISRDVDMTDIARKQWLNRILHCSTPEDIDFSNVNVVLHVRDEELGRIENAHHYLPLTRDMMRAAYSQEACSYVVTKTGIYPEKGCSRHELIAEAENILRMERISKGQMQPEDIAYIEERRRIREAKRTPSCLSLEAA